MKSIAVRAAVSCGGAVRAGACLVLLVMVVAVVVPVLAPAPAHADVNTGIKVTNLALVKTDSAENPLSGRMETESIALLTFDWDAGGADLKDGDSFSIDLPEELRFRVPQTRAFTHFVDGVETEVGTCVIGQASMVCTFNEVLPRLIGQGYKQPSGSGKIQVYAAKATTQEELSFTVNGSETVMVDLPGEGGIGVRGRRYTPETLLKGANAMSEQSTGVTWSIIFSTDRLQPEYARNGVDVAFDGRTVHSVELTDVIGPGQTYPEDLSRWRLTRHNSADEPNPQTAEVVLASAAEGSRVTDMGEFSIKVTYSEEGDSGQSARIVLTGPFAPQTNYRVIYESRATTEDGKAVPGFRYENYVAIDGTTFERDASRSFLDSFSLTVTMEAGYGTFSLDKYLTGPASDHVPAGSTFTVNLAYELPNGATQDSYPGWTAPGTLNDARTGGTASFEVTMGRKNVFVGPDPSVTFPAGTVVTLTEAAPSIALPEGYSWGEGLFVVGGVPTSSLTIRDQQVLGAELTNQVRAEPSTFEVVKTVDGAPGAESKDYSFTYTCSDGTEGTLTAKGDGQPVRATDSFEVGTTCTIAESTEGAEVSGYDLEAPLSQRVRVTAGTTVVAQASFTNTYTARTGTFTIAKTVAGDGDFSGDTFAFDYTCSEGTTGSLEAPGTGEAVSGPELPGGTTCEISEDAQSAAREGYSVDSELSASTVTISQDAPVAVSATNTYSQDTGTFSVAKSVAGDGDFSGDTFAFDYTCSTGESGTLQVPADGTAVTSPELPAGAQCEVSEQEGSAARQGYSVDTGLSATQVTVVAGEDTAVSATNTYSQDTGTFSVAKQVVGDGDFGGGSYSVTYQCTLPDGTTQTDTLSVTGGATVNGPSLPVGTQCTVSEEDASQAGYALATSTTVEGQTGSSFAIAKDATTAVVLTNTYTQLTGGFQVAKTVEGDASAKAPQEFVFDYTCTTEDGSNPSGEVRVKAGESAQVGVPVGECVVTERAADVDGADRSTTVTVDGSAVEGEQATVTVSEGSGVAVEVTNTYTAHRGTFSVAKKAEGAEVSDTEFSFSYTCTDGSQGMLSAKADGQAVEAEQTFPVGTECTVTENEGAAQVEGYDLAASGEQEVAVTAKGEVVATTFTNTYTAHTGTFSLTKVATGADDEIADKKFSFSYTCTDGSEGTLSVKAGETVSPDKQLPLGTTCTLVEDTEAAGIDGYTLTGPSKESLTAPIVNKDQVVALKAVNTYEKPEPKETDPSQESTEDPSEEPTGEPTDGSSASAAANASSGVAGVTTGSADPGKTQASSAARPTGSLARTGATVLLPVAVALAAIAGGVALLRRRRS